MADFPVTVTAAGAQPILPPALRAILVAQIKAVNPGFTDNLPGSLIEDIVSTVVYALSLTDSARIELLNSLSPQGANAFVLNQLGQMLGVNLGQSSNTSVFVVFSGCTPGFVIGVGFTISDGTYQYVIQDGGVASGDGNTPQLFALATQQGSWAVPANTVVNFITSLPTPNTITVTNPAAGLPGAGGETETSYRARVLQANLAASQGMSRYLRTFLSEVDGVQDRLIAALQQDGGGWEIIVGGGDPYQVANAIWTALFDISTLVGSTLSIAGITNASPGVISTFLNHGFSVGQAFTVHNTDPPDYEDNWTVLTVPNEKSIGMGIAFAAQPLTAISWAATAGGQITATTTVGHGVTEGSTFVLANNTPSGYDGTYIALAGTTGSTLIATQVVDPGVSTVLGNLVAGIAIVDTTSTPPWVSGGYITPNLRNINVTINDYPDTYVIPYVNPPQQIVTLTATWNTTSPNFVSNAAISQAAIPAIVAYINGVYVGKPINTLTMGDAFQAATASILPAELMSNLTFSVSINGIGTAPEADTNLIFGDPESYFFAVEAGIVVEQG